MISHVAVTIPACNEQDEIGDCLLTVERACSELEQHSEARVSTHIVVALDACTDGTAEVVARFPGVEAVAAHDRCVGAARHRAASRALDLAAAAAGDRLTSTWLASTDADCRVPIDWLIRMVGHADAGHDLVLGTVLPLEGLTAAQHHAWLERHEQTDGHPHVHGANLGVRANTYLGLGGWPRLSLHEDVELVARAAADQRCRIHRSGSPPVLTSSRLTGRVELGFAGYLRSLVDDVPAA